MRKVILAGVVLVIVALALYGGFYLLSVHRYKSTVAATTYDHADASAIADGTYIGVCDVDFITAKVKVTVKNGVITDIDLLEHRHERGAAAEGIGNEIVAQQKIDVDAVSGATNSSTVIKKAVDNALSSAEKQ